MPSPAPPARTATAVPPVGPWRLPHFLLFIAVLDGVLVLHGLIPGVFFPSLGIAFPVMGRGHSLALGDLLDYPRHFGHPLGAPIATGLPATLLQAVWMRLLPLHPLTGYILAQGVFISTGFGGACLFFRRCGIRPVLSIAGAGLYLSSIFVLGHQAYANLMLGFVLLPLSMALDLSLRTHFQQGKVAGLASVGLLAGASCWKTLLLFTDGYSFVISAVFSGSVLLYAAIEHVRLKRRSAAAAYALTVVLSHAAAYAAYAAYIPGAGSYDVMPADYFRGQGVDLATWVIPFNRTTQLATWLQLDVAGHKGREFFGDGSNVFFNYFGLTLLLCLPGAVHVWRRRRELRPLLLAGFACFLLALGPAIKIHDLRTAPATGEAGRFDDYLMSPSQATLNLHTESFYRSLPGIQVMRSVYRWQVGGRVIALLLAIVTISLLYERSHRIAATVLLLLLALDTLPPVEKRLARYARNQKAAERFYHEAIPELRAVIPPGSVIIFVSQENDYLANPIAAALECRAYNVGGDKNQQMARLRWPEEAKSIMAGDHIAANAGRLHARGELDFVIIPHFNLRWHAYAWPPARKALEDRQAAAQKLVAASPGPYKIIAGRFATVLDFTQPPASDAPTDRKP